MKILVDKNSKVVLTKCEDDIVISQDGDKTSIGSDLLLWGITASNSDIVEDVTLPTSLVAKLYSYDAGTWTELWETVKAKAKVVTFSNYNSPTVSPVKSSLDLKQRMTPI